MNESDPKVRKGFGRTSVGGGGEESSGKFKQSFMPVDTEPWGSNPHPNPMRGLFSCFPLFSLGEGRKRRAEEAANRRRTTDQGVSKGDESRVEDVTSRVEIGDISPVFGMADRRADRGRGRRPRRHFPANSVAGAIENPVLVMQQTPRRRRSGPSVASWPLRRKPVHECYESLNQGELDLVGAEAEDPPAG
jgi:hypothetical protein